MFSSRREAFVALWTAGAGRDALIAASLIGRDRLGWIAPDDAAAAVREVDAFLTEVDASAIPPERDPVGPSTNFLEPAPEILRPKLG